MGTDIHWIIERRDESGAWRAVASKTRVYDMENALNPGQKKSSGFMIGLRNYTTFGALSGLHGLERHQIATDGVPDDISDGARAEIEYAAEDGHSHCWMLVGAVSGDISDRSNVPEYFFTSIAAFLATSCDTVLPAMTTRQQRDAMDSEKCFVDAAMLESAHAKMARIALSKTLLPVETPDATRMIIFFDN